MPELAAFCLCKFWDRLYRRMYVREVLRGDGKPKQRWVGVGNMCLRCGSVKLDTGVLRQTPDGTPLQSNF
jgi:hypothetical protein